MCPLQPFDQDRSGDASALNSRIPLCSACPWWKACTRHQLNKKKPLHERFDQETLPLQQNPIYYYDRPILAFEGSNAGSPARLMLRACASDLEVWSLLELSSGAFCPGLTRQMDVIQEDRDSKDQPFKQAKIGTRTCLWYATVSSKRTLAT